MAMCSMWEWDCDNYSGWPLTLKQAGHSPPTNSCKYPEKRWLVQKYPELPLQKYWPLQKNLSIVSYSFQSIVFKCSDKLFLPQRVLGISSWLPHNYKFTIRLAVLSFTISCYSSPFLRWFYRLQETDVERHSSSDRDVKTLFSWTTWTSYTVQIIR